VLDRALDRPIDDIPADLFGGLAGIGLNLLHFAEVTGDRSLGDRAIQLAARVAVPAADSDQDGGTVRTGLMYGASGPALFFTRMFEYTGDANYLNLAEQALRRDLAGCVLVPDGTLQVNEGWRVMPYVATGSAGIGLVLNEYLAHRQNEELHEKLDAIARATMPEFVIGCGLFNGRAGLLATRCALARTGAPHEHDVVIERHTRRLSWHMVPYQGQVAFPGDQLLRLSTDLATGSAGVLLGLASARAGDGVVVPFVRAYASQTSQNLTPA
jgi:hypothetical protein